MGRTRPSSAALSADLRAEAAKRIAWAAPPAAALLALLQVLQHLGRPSSTTGLGDPVNRLLLLGVVLMAAGLFALHHFRVTPASRVLTVGMIFEVVYAGAISALETSGIARETRQPFGGVSAVGPWIVFVSAFVPNRPLVALAAGLLAASTWPVAFVIDAARFGTADAAMRAGLLWSGFNYVMAAAGFLVSRTMLGAVADTRAAEELGSYHLVARIGEGGMGEVWTATHRMLARSAAIKLIRPEALAATPDRDADAFLKRFRREANAIAGLQSPHTIYLYDFGRSDDGRLYYVMELLDGISLQTLVTRFGPQPPERVVSILLQVCESLDEAHQQGVVHRDLKPSNVMVCRVARRFDFVKVLDFGLAKTAAQKDQTQLTVVGTTTGTPGYMAPEMIMGDSEVDGRADLYAVGCVAYYLLTGTQVFDDDRPASLALQHVQSPPPPPSERTELPIPRDLEAVILQCLSKRPGDRPATACNLAARLRACNLPAWTADDAAAWWEHHLPPTSSLRLTPERRVPPRQAAT
jgi:serine/threonine-protein kinase